MKKHDQLVTAYVLSDVYVC